MRMKMFKTVLFAVIILSVAGLTACSELFAGFESLTSESASGTKKPDSVTSTKLTTASQTAGTTPDGASASPEATPANTGRAAFEAKKIDPAKDWVYDAYFSTEKLKVPCINFKSDDADAFNTKFADEFESWRQGNAVAPAKMEWKSYLNEKVLTIVITTTAAGDQQTLSRKSYFFNLENSWKLSEADLYKAVRITATEADERILEFIGAEVLRNQGDYYGPAKNYVQGDIDSSLADYRQIKSSGNLPIYLDNEGNLMVILKIFKQPDAQGYYYATYKIE